MHAPQIAAAGASCVLVLYNSLYNVCMCVCETRALCWLLHGRWQRSFAAVRHRAFMPSIRHLRLLPGFVRYGSAVVGLAGGMMSQLGTAAAAAAAIVLLFCVACVCVCEFLL